MLENQSIDLIFNLYERSRIQNAHGECLVKNALSSVSLSSSCSYRAHEDPVTQAYSGIPSNATVKSIHGYATATWGGM